MPFYRMNGTVVHIRGSKRLPPPCSAAIGVQTSDGSPMQICGAFPAFQCDWPVASGQTCDRHLCGAHAHEVAKNRHYCPAHHQALLDEQAQLGLFTSLVVS